MGVYVSMPELYGNLVRGIVDDLEEDDKQDGGRWTVGARILELLLLVSAQRGERLGITTFHNDRRKAVPIHALDDARHTFVISLFSRSISQVGVVCRRASSLDPAR
jgi:hypothetical protein